MPTQISYRGYKIEKEFDPWALQYGMNYRYYRDGERIFSASTIEEAKEEIDELRESIAYEQSKRLQPFNPSLSDFSEDHLKVNLKALTKQRVELQQHINSLNRWANVGQLMRDEVIEFSSEIKILDELIVQFAGAIVNKRKETAERN